MFAKTLVLMNSNETRDIAMRQTKSQIWVHIRCVVGSSELDVVFELRQTKRTQIVCVQMSIF